MGVFQIILLICFQMLVVLANRSEAQEISIKGQFYLSGKLDYQFVIQPAKNKRLQKSIELEPSLNIELTSVGDVLKMAGPGQWVLTDNGDGIIAGHVHGQIPLNSDSELISSQMIILSEEIKWFPIEVQGYSYKIEIQNFDAPFVYVPSEKKSVCGPKCLIYSESRSQRELYVVLGNYTAYTKTVGGVQFGVALHQEDASLADSYLQLLPEYVSRYSGMIGPYPFQEFWVIENENETGYGMPGFTLLGKSVIRLPFLLKSSLPHEVLHNWLGNSIFVNYDKGNWCEGLTTHLADHYEQKILKQDSSYRRNAILNYMNFAAESADFPLVEFKGRHSGSTQAVGYDKSMMVFQMIQDELGEAIFYQRLQQINRDYYFQQLGFEEFIKALFSHQVQQYESWLPWVKEKGMAQLSAKAVCLDQKVMLKIESQPRNFNYQLEYLLKSKSEAKTQTIAMKNGQAELELPTEYESVHLDPNFKVFRKLSEGEKPLALSEVFGKKQIAAVVDENLKPDFNLWQQGIQSTFPINFDVVSLPESQQLKAPSDLILYYSESLPQVFTDSHYLASAQIDFAQGQLMINGQAYTESQNAWVIMGKNSQGQNILWVKPQAGKDSKAWARQLTHYTQMGVLVFKDRKNIFKNSYAAGKSELELTIPKCQK